MYSLLDPPTAAPLAAHAETFTAHCFEVSARSLDKLPVEMPILAGKRQPMPVYIFSALLARVEDVKARNLCLYNLPDEFCRNVQAVLPKALEAYAEQKAGRKAAA
jgi:hypothetical protein